MLGETADGTLVHIELQSTNQSGMALRMLEYAAAIRRQFGHFPEQVVVYVGQAKLRMNGELQGFAEGSGGRRPGDHPAADRPTFGPLSPSARKRFEALSGPKLDRVALQLLDARSFDELLADSPPNRRSTASRAR